MPALPGRYRACPVKDAKVARTSTREGQDRRIMICLDLPCLRRADLKALSKALLTLNYSKNTIANTSLASQDEGRATD